jgi:hypothetical protein
MKTVEGKVDYKIQSLIAKVDIAISDASKEADFQCELAAVQVQSTENTSRWLEMQEKMAKALTSISELQSPKDVLTSSAHVETTRERAPTQQQQQPKCIISAPSGTFVGKTSAERAQDFNKKVVTKLKLQEGHFSSPEAMGMVSMGKRASKNQKWVVTFNSDGDVAKMFSYKWQLKTECPEVYVEPFLTKVELEQRNKLWEAAQAFKESRDTPRNWRFRWIGNVKGLLTGPGTARRYVIIEGDDVKVVAEGDARFGKKGHDKGEGGAGMAASVGNHA